MKICGVEEAGRGPVLGPLVMCGVLIDEKKEHELVHLGVKDSKLLSPAQRERLFDKILEISEKHVLIALEPLEIYEAVFSKTTNLNWLEAETSAKIINTLAPDKVIVDCPSPNIPAYTERLQRMVNTKTKIIAEHKADVKYPVVSASSILAKVTRDRLIEKIKHKIGIDFGSGYPADPRTQAFLKKHAHDFPGLFRTSWKPYQKAAGKKKNRAIGEF